MITASELRKLLDYDPKTGEFRWLVARSNRIKKYGIKKGQLTGVTGERPTINIDHHVYRASRLAFLWMTGRWPKKLIDHRNRNTRDNRWVNLREATHQQNSANCRSKSSTGFKGVHYDARAKERKYMARITVRGRTIGLGSFEPPDVAHVAYLVAAKKHFGEFARRR